MNIFGDKAKFAIGLEKGTKTESRLKLFINGADILQYIRDNKVLDFEWDLEDIVEWFEENIKFILTEEKFPVIIDGDCGVKLYNNSLEFESENDEIFDEWFDKVQEWGFRHSWFSSRAGSFLADIYFRRIDEKVELSWDNKNLFDNIRYVREEGTYYVDINEFQNVITQFINFYNSERYLDKNSHID